MVCVRLCRRSLSLFHFTLSQALLTFVFKTLFLHFPSFFFLSLLKLSLFLTFDSLERKQREKNNVILGCYYEKSSFFLQIFIGLSFTLIILTVPFIASRYSFSYFLTFPSFKILYFSYSFFLTTKKQTTIHLPRAWVTKQQQQNKNNNNKQQY